MSLSVLQTVLNRIGPAAIAVSGGVDSLTLAAVACAKTEGNLVCHAVSPAVPERATQRVRQFARTLNWDLLVFDAGEFSDPKYRSNPVNRCFYCKTNLYGSIARQSDLPILSGTNLDDLEDFRPGLDAARTQRVRHPFVEARITKNEVRGIARQLGLADITDLPASPCLSSRVTTGLPISGDALRIIDRVEAAARDVLGEITLRCRLTESGFQLAIDEKVLASLKPDAATELSARVSALLRPQDHFLGLHPYQRGSAFAGKPI